MIIGKNKTQRNYFVRAEDFFVALNSLAQHLNMFLQDVLSWGKFKLSSDVDLMQQS